MIETLRISVITPVFPTDKEGHRGIYIYNIVRSLQRHAKVEVICALGTYPRLAQFLSPSAQDRDVNVHYSPADVTVQYVKYPTLPMITRPLNSMSCRIAIKPHVINFDPHVILAYWAQPEGLAAVAIGRELDVPVIIGALGSDLLVSKGVGKYLAKRAVTHADRVLTVSDGMSHTAAAWGVPADRVKTIPNGCDHSVFYQRERKACREKLRISLNSRLILFVGRLETMKGLHELVDALVLVRREFADAELVCIGEGPMKQFLSALPHSARVRALGKRTSSEIADWLGACDLLCLPSHSEGCPNVVVEALSCGRPVIGTNVGGIPALVGERSGILVPPQDIPKLAGAICEGLYRHWNEAEIAARIHRSWDDVADETYGVCLEALAERRRLAPANAGLVSSNE